MGNSASTPTNKFNNPNDTMQTAVSMNDMCVSGGNTSSATKYMPQNGEYEMAGTTGNCNYCINCEPRLMEKGSGCDGGGLCANGGGSIPQYRRKSYNADKTTCCTNGGGATVGDQTCDPKYKNGVNTQECNDVYQGICDGTGLTSSTCKTWCNLNPTLCKSRTQSFCNTGNNMAYSFCQDAAKAIGGMDAGTTRWCSANKDSDFCSCYKSINETSNELIDPESKAILSRPECYVTKCSSGTAYQYDNMKSNKSCPPVNLCKNTISIIGNTEVNLANVTQSCAQSITTAEASPVATVVAVAPTTTTTSTSVVSQIKTFSSAHPYLVIFIIVILISLGVGAVYMASQMGDDDEESGDTHIMNLFKKFNQRKAPSQSEISPLMQDPAHHMEHQDESDPPVYNQEMSQVRPSAPFLSQMNEL